MFSVAISTLFGFSVPLPSRAAAEPVSRNEQLKQLTQLFRNRLSSAPRNSMIRLAVAMGAMQAYNNYKLQPASASAAAAAASILNPQSPPRVVAQTPAAPVVVNHEAQSPTSVLRQPPDREAPAPQPQNSPRPPPQAASDEAEFVPVVVRDNQDDFEAPDYDQNFPGPFNQNGGPQAAPLENIVAPDMARDQRLEGIQDPLAAQQPVHNVQLLVQQPEPIVVGQQPLLLSQQAQIRQGRDPDRLLTPVVPVIERPTSPELEERAPKGFLATLWATLLSWLCFCCCRDDALNDTGR